MKAQIMVDEALKGDLIGTPYAELDCQALMEKLLTRIGVKHPNWRGSNHMWREAVSEREAISASGDEVPPGAWLFTIKHDGGEIARGYNDDFGNAAHVGLYLGDGRVIHSTTGGVQWDTIASSRWTHYALCDLLDYSVEVAPPPVDDIIVSLLQTISRQLDEVLRRI